jgi:hypothetical protein
MPASPLLSWPSERSECAPRPIATGACCRCSQPSGPKRDSAAWVLAFARTTAETVETP